ncbi:hypothetical protein [Rhizobium paknamense]|uniref:Uncharacterized protein n=1 Tax=Rhizobium paknamense TaxID=1206817 RepID=A0ABU0I8C8_9HYPH|nr:hypothetical protein [Rhizobium paknamense]MDQ0454487.1 hypothetical protein [Rhizobium paknamense]
MAQHSMSTPADRSPVERHLDTAELIDRLAHELKATSDADLPHCYFVEQARLRLAGQHRPERSAANDAARQMPKTAVYASSSVFYAWAMPE